MLRGIPVRWRVLSVLFVVSFVNYFLRNVLSVAMPSIRTEFGFTKTELGWILGSFGLSYTLLQIPGGLFGQRYGTRRALGYPDRRLGPAHLVHRLRARPDGGTAAGAMVALVACACCSARRRRRSSR